MAQRRILALQSYSWLQCVGWATWSLGSWRTPFPAHLHVSHPIRASILWYSNFSILRYWKQYCCYSTITPKFQYKFKAMGVFFGSYCAATWFCDRCHHAKCGPGEGWVCRVWGRCLGYSLFSGSLSVCKYELRLKSDSSGEAPENRVGSKPVAILLLIFLHVCSKTSFL